MILEKGAIMTFDIQPDYIWWQVHAYVVNILFDTPRGTRVAPKSALYVEKLLNIYMYSIHSLVHLP